MSLTKVLKTPDYELLTCKLYSASFVNMQRIRLIQSQLHYATTKSQVFIIKNDIIYYFLSTVFMG